MQTNLQFPPDLFLLTKRICNGKLHFLYNENNYVQVAYESHEWELAKSCSMTLWKHFVEAIAKGESDVMTMDKGYSIALLR